MRRSSRLICSVGLALSMFAPLALASPPVLDRVPGNAVAVITTPSLAKFHKNADAFIKAIEAPIPFPGLDEMLGQIGIEGNKGFDPQKSIAMTFLPPPDAAKGGGDDAQEPDPEQMVVIIVQTTGYADFVSNFGVKPGAAGEIDSGKINESETFFKDLGGGFAAMAPKKETIERAEWKDNAAAHKAALGKAGDALVDNSDLSMIVFTQQAKQYMPQIEKAIEEQMAKGDAGEAIGALKDSPLAQLLTGPMMDDSTATVTSLRASANGVAIDTALAFKEGSESAKMLAGITGSSSQLLSKLPAQPYLFAFAADLSSPGARRLVDQMTGDADANDPVARFASNWFKNSDGTAVLMGMPPGGLMGGGLFAGAIAYLRTSSPDAFIKNMQQGLQDLNGKAAGGLKVATSYTGGGSDIEGTKVDTWAIELTPDEDSEEDAGQITMALPFIFGQASGPAGYIAKTDHGVYQTFTKSQTLMQTALTVGKGTESFTSDKILAKVSEQLPKNRVGELYVGVKSILEAAIPLMAMGQIDVDVEVPPSLPPIGVGVAGDSNGVQLGAYLPAPTLKTIWAVVQQVQAAQMAGEPPANDAGKKNDGKKGAGQPRF